MAGWLVWKTFLSSNDADRVVMLTQGKHLLVPSGPLARLRQVSWGKIRLVTLPTLEASLSCSQHLTSGKIRYLLEEKKISFLTVKLRLVRFLLVRIDNDFLLHFLASMWGWLLWKTRTCLLLEENNLLRRDRRKEKWSCLCVRHPNEALACVINDAEHQKLIGTSLSESMTITLSAVPAYLFECRIRFSSTNSVNSRCHYLSSLWLSLMYAYVSRDNAQHPSRERRWKGRWLGTQWSFLSLTFNSIDHALMKFCFPLLSPRHSLSF